MLRLLNSLLFKEAAPFIYKQSCSFVMMSSEITAECGKRKSSEVFEEDSCSKEPKLSEEAIHEDVKALLANTNRYRKPKKAVLLLSYLGKEYYGMQRNQDVSTVEEELLTALLKAGVIIQDEFDSPKTMKFQRAARTDKGVSAVRQIVSLKLPVKEICDALPEKINAFLPSEIRLIAAKRVIQSFDAKIRCDARTYSYMFPTFAFSPDCENDEEYRITDDRIEEVNKFLQNYIGTHNFFNFTSGRIAGDPSCKRYIITCECGPPFISHGIEFSIIKVKGQSFMLHQIRKMVGLAIAYMRKYADESVLKKAWQTERIDIPKAPGLGLMLEELHYDWYNSKYGSDGMHEPLIWNQYDDVVNKFKTEKICSNIAITEREEKSMMQWLETLPKHTYDVREDGPPSQLPSANSTFSSENEKSGTLPAESLSDEIRSNEISLNVSCRTEESSPKCELLNTNFNSNNENEVKSSATDTCISKEKEIKCEC